MFFCSNYLVHVTVHLNSLFVKRCRIVVQQKKKQEAEIYLLDLVRHSPFKFIFFQRCCDWETTILWTRSVWSTCANCRIYAHLVSREIRLPVSGECSSLLERVFWHGKFLSLSDTFCHTSINFFGSHWSSRKTFLNFFQKTTFSIFAKQNYNLGILMLSVSLQLQVQKNISEIYLCVDFKLNDLAFSAIFKTFVNNIASLKYIFLLSAIGKFVLGTLMDMWRPSCPTSPTTSLKWWITGPAPLTQRRIRVRYSRYEIGVGDMDT